MSATMKQAQDAIKWLEASYDAGDYTRVPLPKYDVERTALHMLGFPAGTIRAYGAHPTTTDQRELTTARLQWSSQLHPGVAFNYGTQPYFDALYGDIQLALQKGHAKATGFSGFGAVGSQADADAAFIAFLGKINPAVSYIPALSAPNGVTNGFRNGAWESVAVGSDGGYAYGAVTSDGTVHSHAIVGGTARQAAQASSGSSGPVHAGGAQPSTQLTTPSATPVGGSAPVNNAGSGGQPPPPPLKPTGLSTTAKVGIGAGLLGAAAIFFKMKS